jgi:glycosyltransferase involved in cell wall biosynthesis
MTSTTKRAVKPLKISFVSMLLLDADMHKSRELELMKALTDRGHITTLVAISSKRHFEVPDKRLNILSIPIRYVPIISPLIWVVFLGLFFPIYILSRKPDFVIMDPDVSVIGSVPALFAQKVLKVKFILDVRSTPVEVIGIRGHLGAFLFNISMLVAKKRFKGIAAVTFLMKNEICKKYGLAFNLVDVWTNGVSIDLFNPKKYIEESSTLKLKLDLAGKFVVLYHGVFTPTRGLVQAVEAMSIVVEKYPQIVLFLLGAGTSLGKLKAVVNQKNLQGNVILHDQVPFEETPKFICFRML